MDPDLSFFISVGTPIIIGLCSRQLTSALKWSAVIGVLWAVLAIAIVMARDHVPTPYMALSVTEISFIIAIVVLLGLFGFGIRQGFNALNLEVKLGHEDED